MLLEFQQSFIHRLHCSSGTSFFDQGGESVCANDGILKRRIQHDPFADILPSGDHHMVGWKDILIPGNKPYASEVDENGGLRHCLKTPEIRFNSSHVLPELSPLS